jgi:hypothetical protein
MDEIGLRSSGAFGRSVGPDQSRSAGLSLKFLLVPACGLIGCVLAISLYPPVDKAPFQWIVLILFFSILFLVSHMRKEAWRGGDVSPFFPMVYWLAWAPVVLALALSLNGKLDHAVPEIHRQRVTRKYITYSSRSGSTYFVELTSWRPNRTTERVSVSSGLYTQFQVDDPIRVEVHRGALAIPWIGAVRTAD